MEHSTIRHMRGMRQLAGETQALSWAPNWSPNGLVQADTAKQQLCKMETESQHPRQGQKEREAGKAKEEVVTNIAKRSFTNGIENM